MGHSGFAFFSATTTADSFGSVVVEERRRRRLFGTLMTTHHRSRWFCTTKDGALLGDDTKIIVVDGNSSRGGRRRRDEREDVFASPETTFRETARAFSAYADVLRKPIIINNNNNTIRYGDPPRRRGRRRRRRETSDVEVRKHSSSRSVRAGTERAAIYHGENASGRTDGFISGERRAEYFFKYGAEGKRMRPTVLLLMASALAPVSSGRVASGNVGRRMSSSAFTSSSARSGAHEGEETVDLSPGDEVPSDNRQRQRRLAEITELIHVASLLHDDVLDGSATRRGLRALNLEVGNKLAILVRFLLGARAPVTLASLRNVEVIELLSRVLEHLVKGEVMQMTQVKEEENENRGASSSSSSSSSRLRHLRLNGTLKNRIIKPPP